MPTGYTADIAKGITFEQFAMRCARAMGACVSMRDEPMDASIPEQFEPNDYHARKLEEANVELTTLRAMTDEEADAAAAEAFAVDKHEQEKGIADAFDLRSKYESMLEHVRAWLPPTPDHERFKQFMLDQLNDSIQYDCDNSYYLNNPPKQITGEQWRSKQIEGALYDIDYHMQEYTKEVRRTDDRNRWIAALRKSLSES